MKFLVGTHTNAGGPGACIIEVNKGELRMISACRAIDNPGYLLITRDKKTVYAAASFAKDEKGAVASYRLENNTLTPLSLQPTGGTSCCHVTLSEDERFLYASNYMTGNLAVFPVQDGYIMPREQLIKHTGASMVVSDRQECAHVHQAIFQPNSNRLFVCDLGLDEVIVYQKDEETGHLIRETAISCAPGCGPRHLIFDGENRFYLGCELSNEVMFFESINGEWKCLQTLSTLPESFTGKSSVAAVRKYKNYLFISNRGFHSACRFLIGKDGSLSDKTILPVSGNFPRDIWPLDKSSLLAANQLSHTVELIENGKTTAEIEVGCAICVIPL
ncbi:MAG: lactonase family protein [Clostridia bacterium]|nr:lactonase family protein [Clostridia bacterium]